MFDAVAMAFAVEGDAVDVARQTVGAMGEDSGRTLLGSDAHLVEGWGGEGIVGRSWTVGVETHHGEDSPR